MTTFSSDFWINGLCIQLPEPLFHVCPTISLNGCPKGPKREVHGKDLAPFSAECRAANSMHFINGIHDFVGLSSRLWYGVPGPESFKLYRHKGNPTASPPSPCPLQLHLILSIILLFCHCLRKMKIQSHKWPDMWVCRWVSSHQWRGKSCLHALPLLLALSHCCWSKDTIYPGSRCATARNPCSCSCPCSCCWQLCALHLLGKCDKMIIK